MIELVKKRFLNKYYSVKIGIKIFFSKKDQPIKSRDIQDLITKYAGKEKIVVVASGPTAKDVVLESDNFYLVCNSAYALVKNVDSLYYVHDGFFIRKILAQTHFLKDQQELLFFYYQDVIDGKDQDFLLAKIRLLTNKVYYFMSKEVHDANYQFFTQFYLERGLPIKVQNSGVFILLFGYYLASVMNKPLEIYGLDLGVGGAIHFDNKGVVGKSVLKDGVKANVERYLSFMYNEKENIANHSLFFSNQKTKELKQ